MRTLEKKLYDLIDNLDVENMMDLGIGVHESSFVETRFPKDAYGYRIYHKDGYCFDITWERQWDEEEKEIEAYYEYHEGIYDGFKSLTIEKAIDIIDSVNRF